MSDIDELIKTPCLFGDNDNFVLERELGKGGMGGVYMGRDKMLDRPVAVKIMLQEYGSDPEFVDKFKREAQAAARLIHPNIAQIYSYGISKGMPYIAMELVAGGSLYSVMKNSGANTDVPRIMKICEQVAQALRCAADQGLVHGDVKPENILLDANGNAKLVDFGLAAMQKDTDEIWGTPYYIAPEKVKKVPVDYRADMYSLGGTLYHALTGVPPFDAEDANAVVRKRFEEMPRRPSELRPELTPQIDELVMRMLAFEPQDRFPSFESLVEGFKQVMAVGLSMTASISPAAAAMAGAVAESAGGAAGAARKTTAGGKKIVMRRKTTSFKIKATVDTQPDEEADTGVEAGEAPQENAEEEEGGNVLGKVAIVIGSIIGIVALVAGGLIWYNAADKKAREAQRIAQIQKGFKTARESLAKTKSVATEYLEKMEGIGKKVLEDCERPTVELEKLYKGRYSQNILDMLRPPKTEELIAAEKALNAPEPEASAPVAAEAQEATTNQTAAAVATNAAAVATNAVAAAKEPEQKAAEQGAAEVEIPESIAKVAEIWERGYKCQAAVLRTRKAVNGILKLIGEAEQIQGDDEDTMRKLEKANNDIRDKFEEVKGAESEAILKASSYINARSGKLIEQARRKVREEDAKAGRAKAKAEKEAAAKAREEAEKKQMEEKIAAERELAKERFETIVNNGNIRQLDWKSARRQFSQLKAELTTVEGEIAVGEQLKKVEMLEYVQTVLKRNLKGYEFTKSKLRGMTCVAVDDKVIVVAKKGSKDERKIAWPTFYKTQVGNFNELINTFIWHGREHGTPRLSAKQRADALFGVGLTMRLICSEVEGAVKFGDGAVKEALKTFPGYLNMAKDIFPDLDVSDVKAAVEAEQF